MCDNQDGTVGEARLQLFLDEVVGLQVNICSSLIKNQNLGLSDDGPSQAKKLLLANGEDVVALGNLGVQAVLKLGNVVEQLYFLKYIFNFFVVKLFEGVEVLTDRALDQEWRLGDVSDALSQQMEANVFDINSVDIQLALAAL